METTNGQRNTDEAMRNWSSPGCERRGSSIPSTNYRFCKFRLRLRPLPRPRLVS